MFLERLSWWEFVRLFKRTDKSLRLKPYPDVVVVSPFPRLAKAMQSSEWYTAARNALLAYCNHGPCSKTFAHVHALDAMIDEDVDTLMQRFVQAGPEERAQEGFCNCPPFIRRAWELGKIRIEREEQRKRPVECVLSSLEVMAAATPTGPAPIAAP